MRDKLFYIESYASGKITQVRLSTSEEPVVHCFKLADDMTICDPMSASLEPLVEE